MKLGNVAKRWQLFDSYCCRRLNKISKRVCITDFVVKKVPRQELTQSIVKTNIEKSCPDSGPFRIQGIALRENRDFGTLTTENPVENDGNFRALMRFHLNATKLSSDESYQLARTNCQTKRQMLTLSNCSICVHLSGSALASIIIKELTEMKIEMQYLRGQNYDEAESGTQGSQAQTRKEKLQQLCSTRWVERHDSVTVFKQLLPAVHLCLEEMTSWANNESSIKTRMLLLSLKECEFNNNVNGEFSKCFNELQRKSNDLYFVTQMPRIKKIQTYRQNTPRNLVQDYFKFSLFIPFLDSFISQLNDRYSNYKEIVQKFRMLFPIVPLTKKQEKLIEHLVEFYVNNVKDLLKVLAEVKIWHHQVIKLSLENNLKMVTAIEVIGNCNNALYPNVYK
ncbi:Hypothetical protein CINCED_3A008613 [Cinara cedri]|uniref:Uncharacterized protein n=1 Tax=Cinara cedri TaxID=506608 RepID=A0A5E4N2H9_9HEMI|nr:Hypothetical protein CINCED_3A008613 [Cinara cedri]